VSASDSIVKTLREERARLGLSLEQVGQSMGRKTYQTVWQLEHETYDPRLSTVRDWADALGFDVVLSRRPFPRPSVDGFGCTKCPPGEHNPMRHGRLVTQPSEEDQ
jgi:transcriptional regulator with XRE-family HTH domain